MNFSKFKYAYSRDGITGFTNILLSKIGLKFRFKSGLQKRIDWVTNSIIKETDNVVASGIYKGMKIGDSKWRENDLSSKLLGLYEKCVQNKIKEIQNDISLKKDYLINIGSADGYHLIGLLKKGLFKQAVVFEKEKHILESLKSNVQLNNIENEIMYFHEANENFIKLNLTNLELKDCFFLIDIEGDEFKILTIENLELLKNSTIIIEFHPKNYSENEIFLNNLKKFFELEFVSKELDNLENFKFLERFSDIDRMLAANEDRTFLQNWIFCKPKK